MVSQEYLPHLGLPREYPPPEFPPIKSANAQILAQNRVVNNRGLTNFLLWYTECSSKTKTMGSNENTCSARFSVEYPPL